MLTVRVGNHYTLKTVSEVPCLYLSQIFSIALFSSQSTVFDDPLHRSMWISSLTASVTKPPRTVYKLLFRQV